MSNYTQNTVSGTSNGSTLTPSYGNSILDSLAGLARVGAEYVDVYSSFVEAGETEKLEQAQQVQQPMQTTPDYQVSNAADFLSDPQRVKQIATYSLLASFVVFGMVIIAKKV